MKFFELPAPLPGMSEYQVFWRFQGGIEMKDWGAVDSKEGIHDSWHEIRYCKVSLEVFGARLFEDTVRSR